MYGQQNVKYGNIVDILELCCVVCKFSQTPRIYREGFSYCLDNIQSVNPYQKVEVLLAQAKITSWALAALREHVLLAEQPRKAHKLKGKGSLNQGTYSWLRKLPWAR
jgi:E3 ubiquitin-protein ligase HERC2